MKDFIHPDGDDVPGAYLKAFVCICSGCGRQVAVYIYPKITRKEATISLRNNGWEQMRIGGWQCPECNAPSSEGEPAQ